MSEAGWQVFATVRKAADHDKLRAEGRGNVVPVVMDVEDGSSITAGAKEIQAQLSRTGLNGLVNVAGIGMVRPI
jgi:NADP-dependent 3-hydroxy acid dehydrogenase YdfG